MIAFVVAALMGIMLIHILKESIPALREVGIKMFLPSSEWRPVSAAPQYGLLRLLQVLCMCPDWQYCLR